MKIGKKIEQEAGARSKNLSQNPKSAITMNDAQKNRRKPLSFLLPLACCLLVFLTGCVRYEVGVNFADQHHGEIVQYIKLGQQLTTLSQAETKEWLKSIEKRAAQLSGKAKRISPQEIAITIPFNNGKDLVEKFNQFFNPNQSEKLKQKSGKTLDLVQLNSQMSIRQSNLLLLERNRINLEVDLRALGVLSNQGNIIVSPGSLIDLEFVLHSPWGARSIETDRGPIPEIHQAGKQLVWHLQPGQINKVEVVFWTPSWLGLGTLGIIAFILLGFYLKYRRWPLVVGT
jgi:hypothetical protein